MSYINCKIENFIYWYAIAQSLVWIWVEFIEYWNIKAFHRGEGKWGPCLYHPLLQNTEQNRQMSMVHSTQVHLIYFLACYFSMGGAVSVYAVYKLFRQALKARRTSDSGNRRYFFLHLGRSCCLIEISRI